MSDLPPQKGGASSAKGGPGKRSKEANNNTSQSTGGGRGSRGGGRGGRDDDRPAAANGQPQQTGRGRGGANRGRGSRGGGGGDRGRGRGDRGGPDRGRGGSQGDSRTQQTAVGKPNSASNSTENKQGSSLPRTPISYVGTATLVDQLDERVLVILRDGRHLVGTMMSYDQFSNISLQDTVERHISVQGKIYCDIPLGFYIVRGENIVMLGDLNIEEEQRQLETLEEASVETVLEMEQEEVEATRIAATMDDV